MPRRPLIIDTDPGKDDAVAVLLALSAPDVLDVRMMTAAAGNMGLAQTTANILRLCEVMGRDDITVHAGCPRPILRKLEVLPHIHGDDGLGGSRLPPPLGRPNPRHAVAALVEALRNAPEPVTLACIAPLTNLALALVMAPDIVAGIREVVVMGGSFSRGNITPYASYNIYTDPHAAQIVFTCGAPVTMIGLDVTRRTMPTPEWCAELRGSGAPAAQVVADLWADPTAFMNDACIIAHLLDPEILTLEKVHVEIETDDCEEIGRTRLLEGDWNLEAAVRSPPV